MEFWDGSGWQTLPGGQIRGNDRALRALTFPQVTTTKIRLLVHASRGFYSRVVEVEARGCPAP